VLAALVEDQNGWRIRTNDELQVMYRKPNIVTTVNLRRLEWAGHVARMFDDRTVKRVFVGKPGGRRKAGRPKFRLYWERSEIDGCQEMEEQSRKQICMGRHSEGGTG
jgi:hypothetical protein